MPTQTRVKHLQTHTGHHQKWASHIPGSDLSAGPLSSGALTQVSVLSRDTHVQRQGAGRWHCHEAQGVQRYGGNGSKASALSTRPAEVPKAHQRVLPTGNRGQ